MKGKTGYLRGFASFLRGFASYGLTIIGYLCNRTRTMLGRMITAPCSTIRLWKAEKGTAK